MTTSVTYQSAIRKSALMALSGFILSGPVGFSLVMTTYPQPEWKSVGSFIEFYHWIQTLPYFFGFLLVGGMVYLVAAHYLAGDSVSPAMRVRLLLALVLTIVFTVMVMFNYVCQTTFVHNMVRHYTQEYDPLIAAFSMANPRSFCWVNEFWGYALLGGATWLMSGYYAGSQRLIAILLMINGPVSILAALWTVFDVTWVLTTTGLVLYFAWNVLMITITALIWIRTGRN